jgi:hypothetical protein
MPLRLTDLKRQYISMLIYLKLDKLIFDVLKLKYTRKLMQKPRRDADPIVVARAS